MSIGLTDVGGCVASARRLRNKLDRNVAGKKIFEAKVAFKILTLNLQNFIFTHSFS